MTTGIRITVMYLGRILSLCAATFLGVWFLMWLGMVLWNYHEMPGIVTREDLITTAVLGTISLCFGLAYRFFAGKTRREQP